MIVNNKTAIITYLNKHLQINFFTCIDKHLPWNLWQHVWPAWQQQSCLCQSSFPIRSIQHAPDGWPMGCCVRLTDVVAHEPWCLHSLTNNKFIFDLLTIVDGYIATNVQTESQPTDYPLLHGRATSSSSSNNKNDYTITTVAQKRRRRQRPLTAVCCGGNRHHTGLDLLGNWVTDSGARDTVWTTSCRAFSAMGGWVGGRLADVGRGRRGRSSDFGFTRARRGLT